MPRLPTGRARGRPRKGLARMRMPLRRLAFRRQLYPKLPSFTETYAKGDVSTNAGGQFVVRISDIPQIGDYKALYQQYRINWVKVFLLPDFAGGSDPNTYSYNQATALPSNGDARIAWAINDTSALPDPANEADVLTDNGAKVMVIKSKWSASFKPRPDKYMGTALGDAGVAVREKFKQWLNFADLDGDNPLHRGISYWISSIVANAGTQKFNVYFKVNFSLRDPK